MLRSRKVMDFGESRLLSVERFCGTRASQRLAATELVSGLYLM